MATAAVLPAPTIAPVSCLIGALYEESCSLRVDEMAEALICGWIFRLDGKDPYLTTYFSYWKHRIFVFQSLTHIIFIPFPPTLCSSLARQLPLLPPM